MCSVTRAGLLKTVRMKEQSANYKGKHRDWKLQQSAFKFVKSCVVAFDSSRICSLHLTRCQHLAPCAHLDCRYMLEKDWKDFLAFGPMSSKRRGW